MTIEPKSSYTLIIWEDDLHPEKSWWLERWYDHPVTPLLSLLKLKWRDAYHQQTNRLPK